MRVLSGFKDIECGSGPCTAVAVVFTILYTLGVPMYVFFSLRAYLSPTAKERLGLGLGLGLGFGLGLGLGLVIGLG